MQVDYVKSDGWDKIDIWTCVHYLGTQSAVSVLQLASPVAEGCTMRSFYIWLTLPQHNYCLMLFGGEDFPIIIFWKLSKLHMTHLGFLCMCNVRANNWWKSMYSLLASLFQCLDVSILNCIIVSLLLGLNKQTNHVDYLNCFFFFLISIYLYVYHVIHIPLGLFTWLLVQSVHFLLFVPIL